MGCCKIIDWFNITILLKQETKKKIINLLNDNCKIKMDMTIELVSASYVFKNLLLIIIMKILGIKYTRMLTKYKEVTSSFSITN
ncbi:hypothetical protein DWY56_05355 [Ruminococcus sp. AF25-3LB]|nr:hypothetical protein DWY56_05355 [Ruminococcus sp. AF25-3LB]